MAYKRPTEIFNNGGKPHPIVAHDLHRHLHLQALPYWLDARNLLDEGNFALGQLTQTLNQIRATDWSEYKRDSARAKQNEMVHGARTALMSFLKKNIERSRDWAARVDNEIMGMSAPQAPKDPAEAVIWSAKQREIRDILRSSEPEIRHALVQKHGLEWIQACVDAPDDIIDGKFLETARRNYAFALDPTLQLKEQDAITEYQMVRKTCGDISAIASHKLIDMKLDPEESMPPSEFYDVFPPENKHELSLVNLKISNYQKKIDEEATKQKFAAEAVKEKEVQTASNLSLEEARGGAEKLFIEN